MLGRCVEFMACSRGPSVFKRGSHVVSIFSDHKFPNTIFQFSLKFLRRGGCFAIIYSDELEERRSQLFNYVTYAVEKRIQRVSIKFVFFIPVEDK